MALWDEVVARYSNQQLIGLTNPDTPDPQAIDQPRADAAVKDASADILTHAQTPYDDANDRLVAIGVMGVVAYLQRRGGSAEGVATETLADFRGELQRYAESDTRRRVTPESAKTPEDHPEFTPERKWDGMTPNPPTKVGSGPRGETWPP